MSFINIPFYYHEHVNALQSYRCFVSQNVAIFSLTILNTALIRVFTKVIKAVLLIKQTIKFVWPCVCNYIYCISIVFLWDGKEMLWMDGINLHVHNWYFEVAMPEQIKLCV